jgi:hypothetical protein
MTTRTIAHNKENWKYGYFYDFEVNSGDYYGIKQRSKVLGDQHRVVPLISLPGKSESVAYLESVECESVRDYACIKDPSHWTGYKIMPDKYDLYGDVIAPLVGLTWSSGIVLPQMTLSIVQEAGLVGLSAPRIPRTAIQEVQGEADPETPLFHHKSVREAGLRYTTADQESAQCPCCGVDIICNYCGEVSMVCIQCGRRNVILRGEAPNEALFTIETTLDTGVSGKDWRGEDFIGPFVSSRVLRLLESVHAYPYVAIPVPVDIAGMSDEALRDLERIRREV